MIPDAEPPTEQKGVYHAARRGLAASLCLTASRLRGQDLVCSVEGQKTGSCCASHSPDAVAHRVAACLRRSPGMQLSCSLKSRCLIPLLIAPQSKDDPDPEVGQSTHSDAMAFPFRALALGVLRRPGFCVRTLPGELREGIAQGFHTGQATAWLGIVPAF